MATVMERGEEAPATTAHLTTTLYDLMAVLQAMVGPEDDALVVATMVHLLRSGRCTWRGVTAQEAPLPAALAVPIGDSRLARPVVRGTGAVTE